MKLSNHSGRVLLGYLLVHDSSSEKYTPALSAGLCSRGGNMRNLPTRAG